MKSFVFLIFAISFFNHVFAQTPDTAPWCPTGATWVYSVFSASDLRYRQHSYIKDTIVQGKNVKQIQARLIRYVGPNNEVRIVEELGFEYYFNSNDSIYFLDNDAFQFIYDFTPIVGDKWITGSSRITCPTPGFPLQDTIRVDSIKQLPLGNRTFEFIMNDSYNRNYVLGNVIKNIGSQDGPFPYVNRNKCPFSSGFYQGLVCYSDNVRGMVPMPNAPPSCHGIITSVSIISSQAFSPIVYPNPVTSTVHVKQIPNSRILFSVFDVSGKRILSGRLINNQINVSLLRPGVYFISFTPSKNQQVTSKFIKF